LEEGFACVGFVACDLSARVYSVGCGTKTLISAPL